MGETWGDQLLPHMPPVMQDNMIRGAAAEQAAFEREQNDRAERDWELAQRAAYNERLFEYQHGVSRSEYNAAVAAIGEARGQVDPRAEYGSEKRVARFVGGRELQPREQAVGPLSVRPDSVEAQLNRARLGVNGREFMAGEIARLEHRRGRHVISRSETPETVTCLDCIENGATAEESFFLHHGPDALPERHVPDSAPSRSAPGVLTSEVRPAGRVESSISGGPREISR